jgi:RNA polymerase sigma-70 factor (ECF subfamily)
MEDEEAALVERARAGDAEAFDQLAELHRAALLRLATSLVGDRDEAQSLAQEAVTRAFEQMPSFHQGAAFGPWIRGIALNLSRKYLRDRARHARPIAPERLAEAAAPEGQRRGVLSGILRQEAGDAALRAVDELPLPLREAFILHYIEGLDYAEIGRMSGIAPGTLRVRAHRARALLRHTLGPVVETWLLEDRTSSDDR